MPFEQSESEPEALLMGFVWGLSSRSAGKRGACFGSDVCVGMALIRKNCKELVFALPHCLERRAFEP